VVDDEEPAVRGVQCAIDWEKAGVGALASTYTIQQAMEAFTHFDYDIVLCDIEMPGGSGLELLRWVRENFPFTQFILLTCHESFQYAKTAIELGCLDYLLKPISADQLEEIIRKAIAKRNEAIKILEYEELKDKWEKNLTRIFAQFWVEIIDRRIPPNRQAILEAARARGAYFLKEANYAYTVFLPVIIGIKRWTEDLSASERKNMLFRIKNVSNELILANDVGQTVEVGENILVSILQMPLSANQDPHTYEPAYRNFIETCSQYFCCEACCYIGDFVPAHRVADCVEQLQRMNQENVSDVQHVLLCHGPELPQEKPIEEIPSMKLWESMLVAGKCDALKGEIAGYLDKQQIKKVLNTNFLYQFRQIYLSMVYSALRQYGMRGHLLFNDRQTMQMEEEALHWVNGTISWCDHIARKAAGSIAEAKGNRPLVEKVKSYISQNISGSLNRSEIAHCYYINADYLGRLFKKETGMLLSDYILEQRIAMARRLLEKTDLPIGEIVLRVGFRNFSYFSKEFRSKVNMNPMEYRKAHKA
jgi:two-component system, response regulator YesN